MSRKLKALSGLTEEAMTSAAAAVAQAYGHAVSAVNQQCLNAVDMSICRLTGKFPANASPLMASKIDVKAAVRKDLVKALQHLEEAIDCAQVAPVTALDEQSEALDYLFAARTSITGIS